MYFKNNRTQGVVAELLEVSQPTVSRAIAQLEGAITQALDGIVPELTEALGDDTAVVDGSLLPCWSWSPHAPELYSGKHKTTGHNHQFVTNLDGRLVHVSEPLPGRTHDAKAVAESGLLAALDPANMMGDKGYIANQNAHALPQTGWQSTPAPGKKSSTAPSTNSCM
ncbi:MAG: transposase family protein [Actinomycetes bacterium]